MKRHRISPAKTATGSKTCLIGAHLNGKRTSVIQMETDLLGFYDTMFGMGKHRNMLSSM